MKDSYLVLGAGGFLGKYVLKELADKVGDVFPNDLLNVAMHLGKNSGEWTADLSNYEEAHSYIEKYKPTHIINCAGQSGGILFSSDKSKDLFYENALINLNVLRAAKDLGVKKVVSILPSCSYPMFAPQPYVEQTLFNGVAFFGTSSIGESKKVAVQYGRLLGNNSFKPISVVLNTLYGPGDSYEDSKAKVVAAIIKKMVEAKKSGTNKVELLGVSTTRRECVYVEDAAKVLVEVANRYEDYFDVLNVGRGEDHSILQIAQMVGKALNYSCTIHFSNVGEGQERKLLNVEKMRGLSLDCPTALQEGLAKTISHYLESGT